MLDIRFVRENAELVKEACRRRFKPMDEVVDELVEIDALRRKLNAKTDDLKAQQNRASKQIPVMKKNGEDTTELMAQMKEIAEESKKCGEELAKLEDRQLDLILKIPNIPNEAVPYGKDDTENVELRRWGEPKQFSFEPKAHWDIGQDLNILDPERAGKVTGARFHFYKDLGARLERAIMNYFLDTHTANGYTEIFPPFMANKASMTGTGQLPKFAEDMYKLEGEDLYLIPTAEVPVTNFHRGEVLDRTALPIKYCAYSACFRAEAGSAGRDTRGLIRQHQFNKVELVKFADPDKSYEELEELTAEAEKVLQGLGLPYRVVVLTTGDLTFSSAKTYDIEVWMPSYGRYVEISSCSNFEDFQARRANIKCKDKEGKSVFAHTLNGSGVAIGRTTAAILENYQNEDGSVTIPEVLRKYMGMDEIR
ncbi:MAG: serine--tRNA ligase [Oscillospiraceae bacterium]|nr:serine--tRNA ligase [Oscillospiraceae bacterium]